MAFFPYRHVVIATRKREKDVLDIIGRNTSDRAFLGFGKGRRYFEGSLTDDGFKINRIIRYQNSFRPILRGTVTGTMDGTERTIVDITMMLPIPTMVFGTLTVVAFLSMLVAGLVNPGSKHAADGGSDSWFGRYGMPVFLYLLFTVPFIIEANLAQQKLLELLDGKLRTAADRKRLPWEGEAE